MERRAIGAYFRFYRSYREEDVYQAEELCRLYEGVVFGGRVSVLFKEVIGMSES